MQEDHPPLFVDVEKDAGNPMLSEVRPHFKDAVAQRPASRHPDRLTELYCFDILAYPLAILVRGQTLQPISQWFPAGIRPEEDRLNSLSQVFKRSGLHIRINGESRFLAHRASVPCMVPTGKAVPPRE
jgi:hypothetical protein